MHIYHFIWGENVVFFRASLGHAGSNEVWPWSAPNCLSSLEECPPSQGTPSSKGGGRILAWRARPMDKLQSSPDPLASFLSWAPLPLTPHRVQRKPWNTCLCVSLCIVFLWWLLYSHNGNFLSYHSKCMHCVTLSFDKSCTLTSLLGLRTKGPLPPLSGRPKIKYHIHFIFMKTLK